jgi:hypothetical protein
VALRRDESVSVVTVGTVPAPTGGQRMCLYIIGHCRPVKQAVSADKGMILRAILAN